ncbi:erythromycin esterase family protein [Umezawaea sp.]|uniref:erythromycin esterase family protein n=1 Tax=Umezawaea sp. TaxID=1955258 RepID=UPI002ECFE02E
MTGGIPTPLISAGGDDRQTIGETIAAQVAHLPHRPRLIGLGEPTHGEDEFGRLRNAVFAALVDRAGFTTVALETSAWHARVVDAYVRGGEGDEDEVMATGFTHDFGASPANRALVRWVRERNRHRPRAEHLRFTGFDAPVEMAAAPSPRSALQVLHDFLSGYFDLPAWETVDRLLGADELWEEPAAARDPARSIGADPRVHALRALTDDLRWTLAGDLPRLRDDTSPHTIEDVQLAARTAAGLLAYHAAMARDTENRWQRLAAIRDTMMAENLQVLADRGPTFAFAHNQHLRTGSTSTPFDTTTLRWQPAGALLADRMGEDYRVIACALGEATHLDLPAPPPDTVEGALHEALSPGIHLLSAPELLPLQQRSVPRKSPTYRFFPIDETLLGQVDQVLFLPTITGEGDAAGWWAQGAGGGGQDSAVG